MIKIMDRPRKVKKETLDLARSISTGTIGHLTEFGFAVGLRPLSTPTRLVGTAITVRVPSMDSTAVHLALDILEPGDVLVIDRCGDCIHASLGGMVAYAAKKKGAAGAVVDGAITDLEEITEHQFPVYCRGVSPLTTKTLGIEGEINTSISVSGVPVDPGYLVIGDSDGVVFLHPDLSLSMLREAEKRQEREKFVKSELDRGTSLSSLSGAEKYRKPTQTR